MRRVNRDGAEAELLARALTHARGAADKLKADEVELSRGDAGRYARGAALARSAAGAAEAVANLLPDPARPVAPTDRDPS